MIREGTGTIFKRSTEASWIQILEEVCGDYLRLETTLHGNPLLFCFSKGSFSMMQSKHCLEFIPNIINWLAFYQKPRITIIWPFTPPKKREKKEKMPCWRPDLFYQISCQLKLSKVYTHKTGYEKHHYCKLSRLHRRKWGIKEDFDQLIL